MDGTMKPSMPTMDENIWNLQAIVRCTWLSIALATNYDVESKRKSLIWAVMSPYFKPSVFDSVSTTTAPHSKWHPQGSDHSGPQVDYDPQAEIHCLSLRRIIENKMYSDKTVIQLLFSHFREVDSVHNPVLRGLKMLTLRGSTDSAWL